MTAADALGVVVVAHNSSAALASSLPVLAGQLRTDDELVIVDCASSDAPEATLAAAGSPGRLLALDDNRGFAGGANAGAVATRAPLLFFLNPDAIPEPGCLDALRSTAAQRPAWGAWQAVATLPGGRWLNSGGNVVHFLGFGVAGGHGTPVEVLDPAPSEVGFASGAALVVRREAWETVGGFDPAYFMYGEDLDLGMRLRLAGWESGVEPAARVTHDYAFAKGDYKWFYLERNRWWTLLGAYPAELLVLLAPALLAFELVLLPAAAHGGWLRAKLRAQAAVVRSLPWALRRRRGVQALRRIDAPRFADGLEGWVDSPFLGPAGRPGWLRSVQRTYWDGVRGVLSLRSRGG